MLEYIIGVLVALRLYHSVQFFLVKRRTKGPVTIMEGAAPFFTKKGDKVALLIHGFTSTPKEFKDLARFLTKHGISVHAPLLPGHGTSPERLAITKYVQWIEFVEEQIRSLEKNYKEIYLIGNSFGGNLALLNAPISKKIKGIVTLGTPMLFHKEKFHRYFSLPLLKRIKIFQKKRYVTDHARDIMLKKGCAYDSIPLRGLSQFLKVVDLSKKKLGEVNVPVLVMQTENDHVTRSDSVGYIMNNVRSKKKKHVIIPDSYHVFILDKHAKLAHKEILSFIEKKK